MKSAVPYIVVLVSAGSEDEARAIARGAVEAKLAACAQLFPIQSFYLWEGAVVEDNEYLVLLKSRQDVFADLETYVKGAHSYDVPEIIALPVVDGSADYLQWLADSVPG